MIIDYSTSRPSIQTLEAAGVTAVGRYIGWDCQPGYNCIGKNLSVTEAQTLLEAGISIFLSFEYDANATARGASQGSADGKLAYQQLAALGAPPGMGVYFAVDFDIPDYAPSLSDTAANALAKLGPVGQYFAAVNALHYPYAVGVYGGYWAAQRVLNAGLATLAWQTVAWSGGQLDSRAVLYQTATVSPVFDSDTDIQEHIATQPDFGQWPRPGGIQYLTQAQMETIMQALPILSSGMSDTDLPYEFIHRLQGTLKDTYGYAVTINGTYDAATIAAVKEIQSRYGLTQDGICGPLTWTPIITGSTQ
jgi:Domain of unknown function (DUF1906)/Putative peptidoglycan binding domain